MNDNLKTIKLIHIAFIIGLSAAYFIVGDLKSLDFLKIPEFDTSSMIYLLIPMLAIILGNFLYKKILSKVPDNLNLEEKFGAYQSASLVRWAMLEGAAFFILFLKKEFILIGLFLILYIAFL